MNTTPIFNFDNTTNIRQWHVVDDNVMGGKSSGNFKLSEEGFGVFEGNISLENSGGFSSVRYGFPKISIKEFSKVILRLKGDGKEYQFRIKAKAEDAHSYIAYFLTSGEWQEIEIPLNTMFPTFRGRELDQPDFDKDYIEEIAFLIGNKKKENFVLMLEKIELK